MWVFFCSPDSSLLDYEFKGAGAYLLVVVLTTLENFLDPSWGEVKYYELLLLETACLLPSLGIPELNF